MKFRRVLKEDMKEDKNRKGIPIIAMDFYWPGEQYIALFDGNGKQLFRCNINDCLDLHEKLVSSGSWNDGSKRSGGLHSPNTAFYWLKMDLNEDIRPLMSHEQFMEVYNAVYDLGMKI